MNLHEILNALPVNTRINWNPTILKLPPAEFHNLIQEMLELEMEGAIEIIATHQESTSGNRFIDSLLFKRLH